MDIKVKDWFSIMESDNNIDDFVILDNKMNEIDIVCSLESLLSEYGDNNILKMNVKPFNDVVCDIVLCLDVYHIKERDVLYFDSENGLTYKVEIINISDFREPSMKYAIDLIDCNGVRYSEAYGDIAFVSQDFIDKCRKELL